MEQENMVLAVSMEDRGRDGAERETQWPGGEEDGGENKGGGACERGSE